eukprot:2090852-Prymnesium_polylepis.1
MEQQPRATLPLHRRVRKRVVPAALVLCRAVVLCVAIATAQARAQGPAQLRRHANAAEPQQQLADRYTQRALPTAARQRLQQQWQPMLREERGTQRAADKPPQPDGGMQCHLRRLVTRRPVADDAAQLHDERLAHERTNGGLVESASKSSSEHAAASSGAAKPPCATARSLNDSTASRVSRDGTPCSSRWTRMHCGSTRLASGTECSAARTLSSALDMLAEAAAFGSAATDAQRPSTRSRNFVGRMDCIGMRTTSRLYEAVKAGWFSAVRAGRKLTHVQHLVVVTRAPLRVAIHVPLQH